MTMYIFLIITTFLFVLVSVQLFRYLSVPRGHMLRKKALVHTALLVLVIGLVTYAWQSALTKETEFLTLLPPYPQARFELLKTPILTSSPYWTYSANATGDQVFNWYRSRSKHAGWTISDEGTPVGRVFVVTLPGRRNVFVVLKEKGQKTFITYTTEGSIMRASATK